MKVFNINNFVYVKLTEKGKQELRRQAKELQKEIPQIKHYYELPKEDEDGWSKWQLHVLMKTFGHMMQLGMDMPFDADIVVDVL